MKRTIALICTAVLIALLLASCGEKTVIIDENGVSHTLVTKKGGDPVQDEYGNMIEEYTNDEGETVTAPFTFPVVTQNGKHAIRNAFISLNIPNEWEYDESIKAFRLQHKDCGHDAVCQMEVETQGNMTVEEEYMRKIAAQKALTFVDGDEDIVSDLDEFTTKIFGLETKAFKCTQQNGIVYYYYIFLYSNNTIGFSFVMNDDCFEKNFDPEAFIKENVSLITIPTEE